jgi:hypothetical protein
MNKKMQVPWVNQATLTKAEMEKVRTNCEPRRPTMCLNTKMVKLGAEKKGRIVRGVSTLNGFVHWSEQEKDLTWHMWRAKLLLPYAEKIDVYDTDGKQFTLPAKPPFGPVEYRGPCRPRRGTPEGARLASKKFQERKAAGLAQSRKKYRNLQAPEVIRMGEMERERESLPEAELVPTF